jgi:hypothetical protein
MDRRDFLKCSSLGLSRLWFDPSLSVAQVKAQIQTRGAYSSPQSFWAKGLRLDDYGINAIFVHSGSIDEAMVQRARKEGARVFAEFATFNGSDWLTRREGDKEVVVEEHADGWPIDSKGQRSPRQTWFLGVCPTNETFLNSRLQALEELVTRQKLDGIWLDYLHWHAQFEAPKPSLPETCFNESCVRRFQEETGVVVRGTKPQEWAQDILRNHEQNWRDWRCIALVNFARRCREVLWQHAPQLLLGNFQCGWRDDEHGGARRVILGLDLKRMSDIFDVMSPMLYHGRSGHSTRWVGQNVAWLCEHLKLKGNPQERLKVWPIVQAWDDPEGQRVSSEDFEKVLLNGASGGSTGVMMFTLAAVAENDQKLAVMKKVYEKLRH